MANEGGTPAKRTISFVMRLIVALIIPAWGVVMLALALRAGEWW
jgi:hypothetical protein